MSFDFTSSRPDPGELLARYQQQPENDSAPQVPRGTLKIFFGMAPGVGKTYAMLAAAQRLAAQGVDIAVGVVETHGRAETEQMLLGLDILPRKPIPYSGITLQEFDVQAAILRRPDILLIDELAHSNPPGSPRLKRWQDVLTCLKAGVNVYTTLNVQHLESVNDVVAQITGVPIRETVPDSVFDQADEIELVDLPVEALHERLRAGKVYLAESATRAVDPSDGYFRKGNLTALRELALRRTASWVDAQLQRYKLDRGIRSVWPAGERILVAISPSPTSGKLIRAAKRMAAGLHAELLAVYVETTRVGSLSSADRDQLSLNLKLAESLGASVTTLPAEHPARELISFARSRNVSKLVVGKANQPRWKDRLFGSFVENLIRESGDIDVYVVRGDDSASVQSPVSDPALESSPVSRPARVVGSYAFAILLVAAVTLLGIFLFSGLDLANIAMVYLAAVVAAAIWLGRGPSILVAAAGVAAFDFCFVSPRWSFAVSDAQYVVTFAVMLAVGLIVGTLTARIREQTRAAWHRERRTFALYALTRELAAAQGLADVASIAVRHAQDTLHVDAILALPAFKKQSATLDVLAFAGSPDWFNDHEKAVAQWVIDHGISAGFGTSKLPSSVGMYIPLCASGGQLGVLGIRPRALAQNRTHLLDSPMLLLVDAIATQIASALERVSLSESQQTAKVEAERERLRSALLSSVSHDLRTPLASIAGAASTLEQSSLDHSLNTLDANTRSSLLRTIVHESARLNDIIANLVFATRLDAGAIALRREWTTLEEVVGVGLARHRDALSSRPVRISIPSDLPMIRVDNALLPQVIHNLVENALRYTSPGTPISLSAWTSNDQLIVQIADQGPGLSDDESAKVFQRFYRGRASKATASPSSNTGMGLGLTICEGVIRLHDGRIWAQPNTPCGVAFMFSLPIEHPQPALPRELSTLSFSQDGSV